jgi:site-specific recombinase XerD
VLQVSSLIAIFDAYVSGSVANGRPSKDTVASYRRALRFWLRWCSVRHVAPARASESDVIAFRQELVRSGYKSASVGHKLTVVGQFYRALGAEGLRSDNPAEGDWTLAATQVPQRLA